ncbi:hypothetical protein [Paenibacillus agilis]|uniref:Nucleotidyltransferase family protein n=1 Tax=Paenibacillus agilis TaxID=3020863 RepID=A0A559IZ23_9BACL|nr:hypothetical protein [Paenibacillus agilis]TVX92874.1 hypothetical protein FPZ44_07290 [Paenibacillus agilis]
MHQQMTETMAHAIEWLASHSNESSKWMIGGSCSLLLQGVELLAPPNDIDVFADQGDAEVLHQLWRSKSTDDAAWNETEMYRSLLSHYEINCYSVELVGQFNIKNEWCSYQMEVRSGLWQYAPSAIVGAQSIRLTPLIHELLFNMLRGRAERVDAIAAAIRCNPQEHVKVLANVLSRCEPSSSAYMNIQHVLPELCLDTYEVNVHSND